MAVRKSDVERARKRIRRRIETIIDAPWFRENVKILRNLLNADIKERDKEVEIRVERNKTLKRLPIDIPKDWHPFKEPEYQTEDALHRAMAINILHKRLPLELNLTLKTSVLCLAKDGILVTEKFLFSSLYHNFEGGERKAFIEYAMSDEDPVTLHYWYNLMNSIEPYEKWLKNNVMKPNRIYIDVTRASLDDVVAHWDVIEELQFRLNIKSVKKGKPKGSIKKSLPDVINEFGKFIYQYRRHYMKREEKTIGLMVENEVETTQTNMT